MSTVLATKPNMSSKTTIQFPQTVNFLEELEVLSRETARRAFNLFQQRGQADGLDLEDWLRAEAELLRPVPIEMSESDDSFMIRAEVPGFDAKHLSIQADSAAIYIRGKNEHKREEKRQRPQIQRILCNRTLPPYCAAKLY